MPKKSAVIQEYIGKEPAKIRKQDGNNYSNVIDTQSMKDLLNRVLNPSQYQQPSKLSDTNSSYYMKDSYRSPAAAMNRIKESDILFKGGPMCSPSWRDKTKFKDPTGSNFESEQNTSRGGASVDKRGIRRMNTDRYKMPTEDELLDMEEHIQRLKA